MQKLRNQMNVARDWMTFARLWHSLRLTGTQLSNDIKIPESFKGMENPISFESESISLYQLSISNIAMFNSYLEILSILDYQSQYQENIQKIVDLEKEKKNLKKIHTELVECIYNTNKRIICLNSETDI